MRFQKKFFVFVLGIAAAKKLIEGKTVGVDRTTLEANAAMKSIVRRDTGEDWKEYVTRLMREEADRPRARIRPTRSSGASIRTGPTRRSATRSGKSSTDPESRIAKMKDGTTHLSDKPEAGSVP